MDARLAKFIALVVTAVWTGSLLADLLLREYDPPASVHVAMMAVVGAATGRYIIWRNGQT